MRTLKTEVGKDFMYKIASWCAWFVTWLSANVYCLNLVLFKFPQEVKMPDSFLWGNKSITFTLVLMCNISQLYNKNSYHNHLAIECVHMYIHLQHLVHIYTTFILQFH